MLVAGGADTQLGSSCVLAPLATNVDLWKPIARQSNLQTESLFKLELQNTLTPDWEKEKRKRRHTSTEGRRNCLNSTEVTQSESSLEGRGHQRLWQRCTHHHDPTWWQLRVVVCIVAIESESGYTSHLSHPYHLGGKCRWRSYWRTVWATWCTTTQKLCNQDCQLRVRLLTHQTMRGPKRQCLYESRADRNDQQFGWQTMNLLKQWSKHFTRTLQKLWTLTVDCNYYLIIVFAMHICERRRIVNGDHRLRFTTQFLCFEI